MRATAEEPPAGTALEFLAARVAEARSRLSAAVSASTFQSESELLNFEEALQQISRAASQAGPDTGITSSRLLT
jgi:hypothetical protein